MKWDDDDPVEREERAAIEAPVSSAKGPDRLVLEVVRGAAPGSITRPAQLLALLPSLRSAVALDAAAQLLDVGHLTTEGGALAIGTARPSSPADAWSFGEGTRAVLRVISSVPNRERDAAASSPDVLLFAAFHREGSPAWKNLRAALQRLKVRVRLWAERVNELRREAHRTAEDAEDGRTVVRFDRSRVDAAIEASIEVLRDDPNLYVRGGSLAFVARNTPEDERRQPFLREESPRVLTMTAPTLVERLCARVRFEVPRGERLIVVGPPGEVVAGVLARGSWPGLRYLRGIIETPTIRPLLQGGTIVDRPGFDESTGYLFSPAHDCQFPPVPARPSREEGVAALAALLDVFVDFPFEREEGRAAAVAALLTMIARPAITGSVPLFAFDATTQGTGKTLAIDAIHAIATGRPSAKTTLPEGRGGVDVAELRKVLDAAALARAASIVFDNLAQNTPIGGTALEAIITTGRHAGRVLGRSEDFDIPWRAVVFATGNNLSTTIDMRRRTVLARLASPFENPSRRPVESYVRPERAGRLVQWAQLERPRLVVSALTLLRAFIVAGAPRCTSRPGSFESWAELVAGSIVWAGGADPLACLLSDAEVEEPAEHAAMRIVARDIPRLDQARRGVTVKELLSLLYPAERVRGEAVPPDGFDDLREALEVLAPPQRPNAPPDGRELGKAFAGARGRVIGDVTIARAERKADGGLVRWRVVPIVGARTSGPALGSAEDNPENV